MNRHAAAGVLAKLGLQQVEPVIHDLAGGRSAVIKGPVLEKARGGGYGSAALCPQPHGGSLALQTPSPEKGHLGHLALLPWEGDKIPWDRSTHVAEGESAVCLPHVHALWAHVLGDAFAVRDEVKEGETVGNACPQ